MQGGGGGGVQAEGGEGRLKDLTQGIKGADFLDLDAGARRSFLHHPPIKLPHEYSLASLPEGSLPREAPWRAYTCSRYTPLFELGC